MAVEWRKVALAAILADGKVDETETKLLQKFLWENGKVSDEGLNFLLDLRAEAIKRAKGKQEELTPAFDKLFFKAVRETVVADNKVAGDKVTWLRDKLFGGKKIDPKKIDAGSKAFLTDLGKKVKDRGPELEQLLKDAGGK